MKRQGGFILLLALTMLAFVGVAILTLGTTCAYDGRRTMDRSQHAQLDQLLLAGATEAADHLKNAATSAGDWWETELPPALAEQQASLVTTVDAISADQIVFHVRAQLQNHVSEQTLRFKHTDRDWKLQSAEVPL